MARCLANVLVAAMALVGLVCARPAWLSPYGTQTGTFASGLPGPTGGALTSQYTVSGASGDDPASLSVHISSGGLVALSSLRYSTVGLYDQTTKLWDGSAQLQNVYATGLDDLALFVYGTAINSNATEGSVIKSVDISSRSLVWSATDLTSYGTNMAVDGNLFWMQNASYVTVRNSRTGSTVTSGSTTSGLRTISNCFIFYSTYAVCSLTSGGFAVVRSSPSVGIVWQSFGEPQFIATDQGPNGYLIIKTGCGASMCGVGNMQSGAQWVALDLLTGVVQWTWTAPTTVAAAAFAYNGGGIIYFKSYGYISGSSYAVQFAAYSIQSGAPSQLATITTAAFPVAMISTAPESLIVDSTGSSLFANVYDGTDFKIVRVDLTQPGGVYTLTITNLVTSSTALGHAIPGPQSNRLLVMNFNAAAAAPSYAVYS